MFLPSISFYIDSMFFLSTEVIGKFSQEWHIMGHPTYLRTICPGKEEYFISDIVQNHMHMITIKKKLTY